MDAEIHIAESLKFNLKPFEVEKVKIRPFDANRVEDRFDFRDSKLVLDFGTEVERRNELQFGGKP